MTYLNREHRLECPHCGIRLYTQIALTKHLLRVHGVLPAQTRREAAVAKQGYRVGQAKGA